MRDLRSYKVESLTENVVLDNYFMSEQDNQAFLLALVKEEFIYTKEQFVNLVLDLVFLSANDKVIDKIMIKSISKSINESIN
tara:strand:+ start:158 stop:403 length:246 start_codon:yes stop_codon:yes gene_type:complete